jgi:branched-chain amino acid transport system ATP-binding protein
MSGAPLLEAKGVTKRFGGLVANDGISFSVSEGEIVSIIGPNGAGKSTLFNCITGFHRPDAGEISFRGKSLVGLPPDRICKMGIARTFQIVQIITDMTVLENVMTGTFLRNARTRAARRKAEEVLEVTGLSDRRDTPAIDLTIADKKRLEVSMALATEPKLLMLDEAMSGLTPFELREMIGLIRKIRERRVTLVIVEHVMEAVMQLSDRVIVINLGKKILEAPPKEVVVNKEVIQAYLGERFRA